MTAELPRKYQRGRIGVSDTRTEFDGVHPWTTRWTGENRDIPMPLGTGGGYIYRRDQKGWIYTGPAASTDQVRFLMLGHTFLPEYGEHEGDISVLNHEYDMLFRLGGMKEMPAEQVIALGFASKPPEVDGQPLWVESPLEAFPQLEGHEIPPLHACKYCSRELWGEIQERNHVSVMHADRLSAYEQANAIATGMREAVEVGRNLPVREEAPPAAVVEPLTETAAVATEQLQELIHEEAAEEPTMRCGICNEGFTKIPLFLAHVKKCKEARSDQGS